MATKSKHAFSNDYAGLVHGPGGINEPRAQGYEGIIRRISEEVVRCLWFGGHFDKSKLYTEDGSRLEIISPGRWNAEGGPDHLDAEILLEGAGRIKGDVEVHVDASDWKRHGHDGQDAYMGVCLHVVMWNDIQQGYVTDSTGRKVPQLALSKYITMPLEEIPDLMEGLVGYPDTAASAAGPCRTAVEKNNRNKEALVYILDQAGDERILSKAKRFEERLKGRAYEQVLYEALMRAMGYKNNVLQFSQLAALVSLEDLRRFVPIDADETATGRHVWIQAMLLGAGGILSHWEYGDRVGHDKRTSQYIKTLSGLWAEIMPRWGRQPMQYGDWHWAGVRPLNQPSRRIAAMSHLLARNFEGGIFRQLLSIFEKAGRKERGGVPLVVKEVWKYFSDAGMKDEFWSHYLTLGGGRLKTPARLIGRERAEIIFINVVLPLFLVYARRNNDLELEAVLHRAYAAHPRNSSDSVVKFMTRRVLPRGFAGMVSSARRQQGLHQVFHDFCQRKDISCDRCGFLMAIQGIKY